MQWLEKINLFILCERVFILPACTDICTTCMPGGVMDLLELELLTLVSCHVGFEKTLNPGPLEEQTVLSTI